MTRPLDKWTSAEIADYARRAEHLTPEDTPMRMTTVDYSWQHPPRKAKRPLIGSRAWFIIAALVTVLASLAIGHVVAKAIAKAAAYSAGGAW